MNQLSKAIAVRTRENADKLHHSLELHCEGDPFTVKMPLKNLVSSAPVKENGRDEILNFSEEGQKRFEEFINDRMLPTSMRFLWNPVRQLKVKGLHLFQLDG